MRRSNGQFMLISAIIVGMIIISTSSMIAELSNREVEGSNDAYILQDIREEAEKINVYDPEQRKNFKLMVEQIEGYESSVSYWERSGSLNCLNVTLEGTQDRYELNCLY